MLQDCRFPQIPLLLLGDVLHSALAKGREGVQLTIISFLKLLNCTEDICFFSHRSIDLGQIALELKKVEKRVALKINTSQVKVFSLTGHHTLLIYINGYNTESVEKFVYLEVY